MAGDDHSFDLVVIGGGAAGLTAAREAVRQGARTALVQAGPLGGDCTFTGCVPSKTLIAAAARGIPFDQAMATVHETVDRIATTEDDGVLTDEGVTVVHGYARLRPDARRGAPRVVEVTSEDGSSPPSSAVASAGVVGRDLKARRGVVLATGSQPALPPIDDLSLIGPLTSDTVFGLDALPPRLAVLGGGAIGCELAQAFARLGSTVTVIEAEDRLLPVEEPEASAVVVDALQADGVGVRTTTRLTQVVPRPTGGTRCTLLSGGVASTVDVDRILVAVGREPVTDELGLTAAGIETDERGHIRTDATLATSAPRVWAAGDVTGKLPFAHAAAEMGRIAAGNALARRLRRRRRFDPGPIPWVTFTAPEVGRVGMTEAEAAVHGGRVAYLPMDAVDRAITAGQTRGFVKLIAGPRRGLGNAGGGRILGATVVAPTGGELIHEPALAMRTAMFTGRLAQATHAYPSWSLAIQQAATQFFMELDGRTARPAVAPEIR